MNVNIINNLKILAQHYKEIGDQWRTRAYTTAIFLIQKLDFKITDVEQLKNIKGIGKNIKEKIQEYITTGNILKIQEINRNKQNVIKNTKEQVIDIFTNIAGVGPSKAELLYEKGLRNLTDVQNNTHLLTNNQKIGLKHYDDFLKPIPRNYIDIFKIVLFVVISKEFGLSSFKMQIAGSYRRGKQQSGDIDCLITSTKFTLKQLVDVLIKSNIITDVLSMRDEKFMGVVHCPSGQWHFFRMDIEFLPEDEWFSGLLYFTGSKEFNVMTRVTAKKLEMTLNQHGLFKKNGTQKIKTYSEQDILEKIGLNYVKPENR